MQPDADTATPDPPVSASLILPPDWPARAADTVERVVEQVRDRTTVPAMNVVRGIVYGILVATVAVVALVLVTIAVVRILDVLLPREVWLAYTILGVLCVLVGSILWAQRRAHDPTA